MWGVWHIYHCVAPPLPETNVFRNVETEMNSSDFAKWNVFKFSWHCFFLVSVHAWMLLLSHDLRICVFCPPSSRLWVSVFVPLCMLYSHSLHVSVFAVLWLFPVCGGAQSAVPLQGDGCTSPAKKAVLSVRMMLLLWCMCQLWAVEL